MTAYKIAAKKYSDSMMMGLGVLSCNRQSSNCRHIQTLFIELPVQDYGHYYGSKPATSLLMLLLSLVGFETAKQDLPQACCPPEGGLRNTVVALRGSSLRLGSRWCIFPDFLCTTVTSSGQQRQKYQKIIASRSPAINNARKPCRVDGYTPRA